MSQSDHLSSREDILYSFAIEEIHDTHLLKEYQFRFPELADELLELYHELIRGELCEEVLDSSEEASLVESAWNQYIAATPIPSNSDPFASLTVPQEKNVAKLLGVRRQVLIAFQEHKVDVDTIPKVFLKRLATALKRPLSQLNDFFKKPILIIDAHSYKSDVKPSVVAPVSFEQILIDAGHSESERIELLSEDD